MNVKSYLVMGTFAGVVSCCCATSSGLKSTSAYAAETKPQTIERDYFVKGMTCGGCVSGVKKALSRAGIEKNQIIDVDYSKPDPEHKIGHAKIRFSESQYRGQETDCRIIKEIKDNPGYIAYLDPANTDPCNIEKGK